MGQLLDLGGQQALAAQAANLVQSVRDALTIDGRLVGLPGSFVVKGMSLSLSEPVNNGETIDLLEQLGFADVPETYAELCDLAEAYVALPAEKKQGTMLGYPWCYDGDYAVSLPGDMIDLYTADACDAAGNVAYDTPAFRAALADWKRLANAVEEDRSRAEDKDAYSLFTEQTAET
jgi:ABC-type glycerol-3-phosphate transport system substrate-binding protein